MEVAGPRGPGVGVLPGEIEAGGTGLLGAEEQQDGGEDGTEETEHPRARVDDKAIETVPGGGGIGLDGLDERVVTAREHPTETCEVETVEDTAGQQQCSKDGG